MYNPHQITAEFEKALCEYTGAPYAVAVNSCTMAILLACKYQLTKADPDHTVFTIPSRTYCSVPQSIIHAGGHPFFMDIVWNGYYELAPWDIYDSARHFTSGMFNDINAKNDGYKYICLSFHTSKILGDTQGGAILHDNSEADKWFRKARFDGRTEGVAPKDDHFDMIGYHCMMSPDVAARLLVKLSTLPEHNDPLPNDDYPDLSTFEVFQ